MAFEEKKEKTQTDCKKVAINTLKRFEKRKRHITIEDIEDIASDNEISTQEVKELVFKLGIEYLMESGLPWYEDLARDEKLWRNRIFNEAPSIIACEYAGLRAMLFKGQVLGLPMKIKDVWETCLKFGVLALLSRQAHSFLTHDADEYAEVLGRLSEKALTLGGWIRLGRDALTIEKNKLNVQGASHELQEPIAKIFDVFNKLDSKGAISNWRNLYIGHGTFIEEENAKQRKLLEKQITLLANYFTATEEYYSQIEFYAMDDTDFIKLLWDKTQPNAILPFTDKALYLKQGEEIFQLLPFIRNYKHGIYFFDSYKRSKNETRYLDYPEGLQIVGIDDELTNLFERVIRRVKYNETIKHTFNESAEDEIYRLECEKALKRLLVPQKLHKMEFINSIIDKWIYDNDSGIFLLQMEQGMGKTTLAKMLDALSFESVPQMLKSNVVCRSIYLNSVYGNTCNYFTSQLYNNLCQLDPTPEVPFDRLESINGLNAESENVAQQVSIFLRTVSEEYKKREGKEGVLLIIDGVDELSDIGIKSVLDLLPSNEDLPNNVYILLTSRINEEISSYTNRILKNIVFVDKYIVTRESEEYINSVRDCITKRLIKNSDENNATEIEYTSKLSDEILQLADRRMTSIDLLLRIYSSHPNIVLSDFTLIVDDYFTLLEQMYGSIYTNEIIRICTCLASVPIPLTINQLAGLLGYHYVSFEFLAYLGEIRPLLNVNKESDKPVLSLTRPEYISYLQKKTDILKTLRCDWKRDVLSYEKIEKQIDENEKDNYIIKMIGWLQEDDSLNELMQMPNINNAKLLLFDHILKNHNATLYQESLCVPIFNAYMKGIKKGLTSDSLIKAGIHIYEMSLNLSLQGQKWLCIRGLNELINKLDAQYTGDALLWMACRARAGAISEALGMRENAKKYIEPAQKMFNLFKSKFPNDVPGVHPEITHHMMRSAQQSFKQYELAVLGNTDNIVVEEQPGPTNYSRSTEVIINNAYPKETSNVKNKAYKALLSGKYKSALKLLLLDEKQIKNRNNNDPLLRLTHLFLMYHIGCCYMELKKYSRAICYFDKGIIDLEKLEESNSKFIPPTTTLLYLAKGRSIYYMTLLDNNFDIVELEKALQSIRIAINRYNAMEKLGVYVNPEACQLAVSLAEEIEKILILSKNDDSN